MTRAADGARLASTVRKTDIRARRAVPGELSVTMTSTAPASPSFAYVACDVPPDQTLVEWRREREASRRAERAARRPPRLMRRLLGKWSI